MKIWLAYKFRGTDFNYLKSQLEEISTLLEARGHTAITMIKDIQNWDSASMSKGEAVKRSYDLIKTCDATLCIYSGLKPSEGRGWDAGFFAGQGKPTIMAIYESLEIPYTEALFIENPANDEHDLPTVIRYKKFEDIANAL